MPSDSDIFLKAIDVLEERGWCQHNFTTIDGRNCIVGSLYATGCDVVAFSPVWRRLEATVGVACLGDLFDWNDAPERTYEDVVLALKRAAHGEQVA